MVEFGAGPWGQFRGVLAHLGVEAVNPQPEISSLCENTLALFPHACFVVAHLGVEAVFPSPCQTLNLFSLAHLGVETVNYLHFAKMPPP